MSNARNLVIVERAYRGAIEVGYFDVLYQLLELHRQLAGVDLLLRDHAATYALDTAEFGPESLTGLFGGAPIAVNDPRSEVRRLLETGVRVLVCHDDIVGLRLRPERLRAGVRIVDDAELYGRWPDYSQILYM
ncbi:hypothetical protein ACFVMC_28170 [Nocardia sp. NPDC127579]|uniref:hypothetical protein n=1 Tax=Nocardia sp. NPDC127579 TaxID=3345402 RepID=UPI00363DA8A6